MGKSQTQAKKHQLRQGRLAYKAQHDAKRGKVTRRLEWISNIAASWSAGHANS